MEYQFKHLKATIPQRNISVGPELLTWRYFDSGPKGLVPLLCLGPLPSTCDVFFKQILSLSAKGYRVLAADWPPVWTVAKWVKAMDQFLDSLRIYQVHIYGTGLGGFLAQMYCQHRPRRVLSLVLSNCFLNTKAFSEYIGPWSATFSLAPKFLLARLASAPYTEGLHELHIADSIDFVMARMETLSAAELASRLALNSADLAVDPLLLPDACITLMDCLDVGTMITQPKGGNRGERGKNERASRGKDLAPPVLWSYDEIVARYKNARKAFLKTGGHFPFLSRADEVNLHLLLHLRHVKAERGGGHEEEERMQAEASKVEVIHAVREEQHSVHEEGVEQMEEAAEGEEREEAGAEERLTGHHAGEEEIEAQEKEVTELVVDPLLRLSSEPLPTHASSSAAADRAVLDESSVPDDRPDFDGRAHSGDRGVSENTTLSDSRESFGRREVSDEQWHHEAATVSEVAVDDHHRLTQDKPLQVPVETSDASFRMQRASFLPSGQASFNSWARGPKGAKEELASSSRVCNSANASDGIRASMHRPRASEEVEVSYEEDGVLIEEEKRVMEVKTYHQPSLLTSDDRNEYTTEEGSGARGEETSSIEEKMMLQAREWLKHVEGDEHYSSDESPSTLPSPLHRRVSVGRATTHFDETYGTLPSHNEPDEETVGGLGKVQLVDSPLGEMSFR